MGSKPNFSKSLSLKWQLSLALILLSMSLVAVYVVLAKDIFESDKIAYIFESRQSQLNVASTELSRKLERGLQDANFILLGLDPATKTLNPVARKFFDSQKSLVAIEVTDEMTGEIHARIMKSESLEKLIRKPASTATPDKTGFIASALDPSRFLVGSGDKDSEHLFIKAVLEIPEILADKDRNGIVALLENETIIGMTKRFNPPQSLIKELALDRVEKTMVRKIAGENYLISSVHVPNSNMKLVAFDSEKSALGALGALYKRSTLFLAFSGFVTILIALLISTGLTKKLMDLTAIAGKIGKGDFSQKPTVTSGNEVGLLQSAFVRMSDEIQNLLMETKEKARMEEELKTARLVQERLFPKESAFQVGSIGLSGMYETSTECGGDWWYYFRNGDDLFVVVADATGHGAPAALNTAASRSLFAHLEKNSNLSLSQLAESWDRSIAASSGQKVYMTAFMMKVNIHTGQGSLLCASHEPPIHINADSQAIYLDIKHSGMLGELVPT